MSAKEGVIDAATWEHARSLLEEQPEDYGLPAADDGSVHLASVRMSPGGFEGEPSDEAWAFVAALCRPFDLLAVRGLRAERKLLERLSREIDLAEPNPPSASVSLAFQTSGRFPGAAGSSEWLAFLYRQTTFGPALEMRAGPDQNGITSPFTDRLIERFSDRLQTVEAATRGRAVEFTSATPIFSRRFMLESASGSPAPYLNAVTFELGPLAKRARRLALARLLETTLDRLPSGDAAREAKGLGSRPFLGAFLLGATLTDRDLVEIEELRQMLSAAEGVQTFLPPPPYSSLGESFPPGYVGALSRQPLPVGLSTDEEGSSHGCADLEELCAELPLDSSSVAFRAMRKWMGRQSLSWLRLERPGAPAPEERRRKR